jgi:hypothetical protein
MAEIRLYWWRPKEEGRINLGDEINRRIVEVTSGRQVARASLRKCDLLAIGSVLTWPIRRGVFTHRKAPITIWGSGTMEPTTVSPAAPLRYSAVRGPLTRCLIPVSDDLPIGDPGLLVPTVWDLGRSAKSYEWGIIPHHSQIKSSVMANLQAGTPRSVLIDFTDPDIDATMRLLASCEKIASSSLHGLIIADAYNIPNIWLKTAELHRGRSWKFYDYFSSVGRSSFDPVPLPESVNNLSALAPDHLQQPDAKRIGTLQDMLRRSFPDL